MMMGPGQRPVVRACVLDMMMGPGQRSVVLVFVVCGFYANSIPLGTVAMAKYACCYDIDDHCIAGKGRHFQRLL